MFEIMITPILMTMLYYLGCVGIVIATLVGMTNGGYQGYNWFQVFIAGAASMLIWRIVCEFVVVRFRMYEVLTEIRDGVRGVRDAVDPDQEVQHPEPKAPVSGFRSLD